MAHPGIPPELVGADASVVVREVGRRQAGLVARGQLLDAGLTSHDVRRLLRRRVLTVAIPWVCAPHTGPLGHEERVWAALLSLWPAALCHRSAIRPGEPGPGPLHVAVDRRRSPGAPPGVRLHHLADLDALVQWWADPPRVVLEQALVSVAAQSRDEVEAVAVLADAVQAGRTTPERLRQVVRARGRLAHRSLLDGWVRDVETGAWSTLEVGYLRRVERAHGLPTADRQGRDARRGVYRDVAYRRFGLLVELDGRLFHDDARSRHRDLDRDLDAAVDGLLTVRLGWGQVFGGQCRTASRLEVLLRRGGWDGRAARCAWCET